MSFESALFASGTGYVRQRTDMQPPCHDYWGSNVLAHGQFAMPGLQHIRTSMPISAITDYREFSMSINKARVKGLVEEATGAVKESAGKLVGNKTLELKGKVQKVIGKAKVAFSDPAKRVTASTRRV